MESPFQISSHLAGHVGVGFPDPYRDWGLKTKNPMLNEHRALISEHANHTDWLATAIQFSPFGGHLSRQPPADGV